MPLYEYACRECGGSFEYLQKIDARPKRKCESCGGKLEKLVSRSGFVLKGSGWYVTDFRDGGKPKPPAGGSDAGGGEKGEGSKAEKPAAKADPKPSKEGGSGDKKAAAGGD